MQPLGSSPVGIARRTGTANRTGGFFLVEVMVTVIVLTVGLLALSALHIQSKQSNLIAVQRSFAIQLAHDLLERMRSNNGGLDGYVTAGSTKVLSGSTLSQPSPGCTSDSPCDLPSELAAYDLWDWEQKLAGAMSAVVGESSTVNVGVLLSPTTCLARNAAGDTVTVAIAWRSTKPISNPTDTGSTVANTCGTTTGKYDLDASGDNKMRHLYWIENYLSAG